MAQALRSRDARRQELLTVATRLANEAPGEPNAWTNSVRGISPRDAATALGMSRTWVYQMWPTREAFARDLAVYECRRADLEVAALVRIRPNTADRFDRDDAFVWLGERLDWLSRQIATSRRSYTYAAVFGYELPNEVAALSLTRIAQAIGRLEEWIAEWLVAAGRRPGDGLSPRDLADLVHLMIDGVRMVRLVAPWLLDVELPAVGAPRSTSSLASAVCSLFAVWTAPGSFTPGEPERFPQLPDHEWSDRQCLALDAASAMLDATVDDPHDPIVAFGWVNAARLARETKVNRHTIYRYWSSDDELRIEVLEQICESSRATIARWSPRWSGERKDGRHDGIQRFVVTATAATGPQIPYLAFLPHLGNDRVAAAIHGVHRFILDRVEGDLGLRHSRSAALTGSQRAGLLLTAWYGARRRFMLMAAVGEESTPRLLDLYGRIAVPLIDAPDESMTSGFV